MLPEKYGGSIARGLTSASGFAKSAGDIAGTVGTTADSVKGISESLMPLLGMFP